jgi:hypothetical protein
MLFPTLVLCLKWHIRPHLGRCLPSIEKRCLPSIEKRCLPSIEEQIRSCSETKCTGSRVRVHTQLVDRKGARNHFSVNLIPALRIFLRFCKHNNPMERRDSAFDAATMPFTLTAGYCGRECPALEREGEKSLSEKGTTENVSRTRASKPRLASGPDSFICAELARQRDSGGRIPRFRAGSWSDCTHGGRPAAPETPVCALCLQRLEFTVQMREVGRQAKPGSPKR